MAAIEPAFDFRNIPEPVPLVTGNAVVVAGENQTGGSSTIRLKVLPRPYIEIVVNIPELSNEQWCMNFKNKTCSLSFNSQNIPGSRLFKASEEGDYIWHPTETPIYLPYACCVSIDRLVFHLFDFFKLNQEKSLTFEGGGWVFTLSQVKDIEKQDSQSRNDGICRMTHVGEIIRKDGASFSSDEAKEILLMLRYFMTFVRGTWCDPVCATGFDSTGTSVWKAISAPRSVSHAVHSWFDSVHPEQITELFPLFLNRWQSSDDWESCLQEVIYWYANANNTAGGVPSIDVSILLSQAALERLSYQFAVIDRRLISAEGFKSPQLRASDKLRLLLSSLKIPIDIPSSVQKIQKHTADTKWSDGPHAYSDIRNALVHPDPKERTTKFECIQDGWKFGLWYLELALLAVCNYNGSYGNRLTRERYGEVESVPWAE